MNSKPNIFEFTDYREYLRKMYEHRKKNSRSFSFRSFARLAEMGSPNYLKLVMDGKRNLTQKTITQFVKGLQLNRSEAEFFENLVYFNQSEASEDKNKFFERMGRSRRYREIKQIQSQQFDFYSQWYHSAIRELVTLPHFKEDPQWIAKTLTPSITAKQAEDSLKLLQRLKLLVRSKRGKLVQTDATLATAPEVQSLAIGNFHRQMLERASDSIENISASLRDLSAITLGLKEEQIPELKKRILKFRRELLVSLGNNEKNNSQVYQMNIQLFPLSQTSMEDE